MNMTAIYTKINTVKEVWEDAREAFESKIEKIILEALAKEDVIIDRDNRPCLWISIGPLANDKNSSFRMEQIRKLEIIERKGCDYFIRILG